MRNAERLGSVLNAAFGAGRAIDFDRAAVGRITSGLSSLASPGLTGSMVGMDTIDREFIGVEGMREAWEDWLDSFARIRLEPEGLEEVGANVLLLVRQTGTTRHGVEVSQPSAAVWKFDRGGRLARVEFHLDRESAGRSARQPVG